MKVATPHARCGCGLEHRIHQQAKEKREDGIFKTARPAVDQYVVRLGDKQAPVLEKYRGLAEAVDRNFNGEIESDEILPPGADLDPVQVDSEDFTFSFKHKLAGLANPWAEAYPTAAQISSKVDELAKAYPDLTEKVTLGSSEEGRPIDALRIGTGKPGSKPAVLIVGGHHAREWVPNQSVTMVAEHLLAGYGTDPEATKKVDSLEIWVVPMANPDGYEFSRNADPDWRKNRSHHHPEAVGVDLNRNYPADFRFYGDSPDRINDDQGASDDPNHLTYRGPHAVSEKETQAITDFMDTHKNLEGVLDVHAFGRLILFPGTEDEAKEARYREVAGQIQAKLDVPYTPLSIPELYPTTGDINAYGEKLGLLSMGLELGTSFQPHPDKAPEIRERGKQAILTFMDAVMTGPTPPSEDPTA